LTTNMIKNLHELNNLQSKEPRKTHPKVCPPGSIIHKKLLMQNKTKETNDPKGHRLFSHLFHKMLASTIQFPNNNPVTPTATQTPHRVQLVRPRPCAGNQKKQEPPPTPQAGQATGLLFQDPTVCQKTDPPPNTTNVPTTQKCGVLITGARHRAAIAC
jgi:hypothetical protein